MEFVAKDWLSDPAVSALREATRGIWMDALCCMFMADRSGQLVGTIGDLARLCRTSTASMRAAIDDLKARGTAEIHERDSIVTLENRRMRRDWMNRNSARLRKIKQREREMDGERPPDVTLGSRSDTNSNPNPNPILSAADATGSGGEPDKTGENAPAEYRQLTDYLVARHPLYRSGRTFQKTEGVFLADLWGRVGKNLDWAKATIDAYLADGGSIYEGHPMNLFKRDMDKFVSRARSRRLESRSAPKHQAIISNGET